MLRIGTKPIRPILNSILLVMVLSLAAGCRSESGKNAGTLEDIQVDEAIFDDISTAKKIFYSLPSPLETAKIIQLAGAKYDEQLLNPVSGADRYTTNRSMALNLGIYSTDMSFASLFDQTQTTITYMDAAKKMADGLGILDAIDENTIQRLEENINNREVIMDIISETFMSSSSYLKENDRDGVATIVLVGGWVEGLYIATQLVAGKPLQGNKLAERLLEQKLSFEILEKLLAQNAGDSDVIKVSKELEPLRAAFDKVQVKSTEVSPEKDQNSNVTLLKSKTEYTVDDATFNEILTSVNNIRSSFIL